MSHLFASLPGLWAMKGDALSALLDSMRLLVSAEARSSGNSTTEATPLYDMDGSVAIVPVRGPLSKNGLSCWGMTIMDSMRGLSVALRAAVVDPSVQAILLDVDSPGGTVDGIEELTETVVTVGRCKPLYAYADGLMASAGYWLACNAREIAAPATADVGSIGVVMMQRDVSRSLEDMGIKYNIITAGRYKAAGNAVEPLSEEMRAYLQSGIDDVYELFLQAVEKGRGVSREKVLTMADGRVFIAGEALKVGLIDQLCSRESFITHIKEHLTMTLAELKTQHAEPLREFRVEVETEMAKERAAEADAVRVTAIQTEQDRIMALTRAVLGESTAVRLKDLVASGVTPEQVTALRGVLVETSGKTGVDKQKEALDALKAAHVDTSLSPLGVQSEAPQGFEALMTACMEKKGCTRGEAIRLTAAEHPGARKAWVDSQQKG